MKAIHKYFGYGTVIVFLLTGLYMKLKFPALYREDAIVRFTFRANHVYILLAGLVNVVMGIYLNTQPRSWRRNMQHFGSTLILTAPLLLVIAFFLEAPLGNPERYITSIGVFILFIGVICHVLSVRS